MKHTSATRSGTAIDRHIGLDWLRIGAFGLLILFHIGLFFAPGHWLVKWPTPVGWVEYFTAATAPWRLMLLFAVSGYATAAMLSHAATPGAFFRERSLRLLVPLVFGTFLIVAPQDWVRFQVLGEYKGGLVWFWTHEELSFHFVRNAFLPNWEHLWFLAYLWAYTALLLAGLAWLPRARAMLGHAAQWIAKDGRLITVPLVLIIVSRALLHVAGLEEVRKYNDIEGDVHYMPAFVFGFMLARYPVLWAAIGRVWKLAMAGSLLCLLSIWMAVGTDAQHVPSVMVITRMIAESAMSWLMLPVLLHAASRWLNRDHRWRLPLARAVFPFYIVHQTAIVLTGFWLMDSGLPAGAVFAIMLAITLAAGMLAFGLASRVWWLGWLLGMPPRRSPASPATSAASA